MADNVVLNPGLNGSIIASDNILGVQYQRNKIVLGADGINDGDVSKTNPIPIYFPPVTPIDRSGTITIGGTAQQLMAANPVRRGFSIQNISAGTLYFNITNGIASLSSKQLQPGALYECPIAGCTSYAISIYGATTGQTFVAEEY